MDISTIFQNAFPLFSASILLIAYIFFIFKTKILILRIILFLKILLIIFYINLEIQWVEDDIGGKIENGLDGKVDYSDLQWSILEVLTFVLSFSYIYLATYYLNNKAIILEIQKDNFFKELMKNPKTFLIFSVTGLFVLWSVIALIEMAFFGTSLFVDVILTAIKEGKGYVGKE